ncbi:hypothetical protein PS410_05295 [Pediococcus acidilactici]
MKYNPNVEHPAEAKRVTTSLTDLKNDVSHSMDFIGLGGSKIDTAPQFYPTAKFDQLNGEKGTVSLITVKNIGENRTVLQKLYACKPMHIHSQKSLLVEWGLSQLT